MEAEGRRDPARRRAWPTATSRRAAAPRCATWARATRWTWRCPPAGSAPTAWPRSPRRSRPPTALLYGRTGPGRAARGAQLARCRRPARGRISRQLARPPGRGGASAAPRGDRAGLLPGGAGYARRPVYDRYALGPGAALRRAGHRRGARVDHRHRPGARRSTVDAQPQPDRRAGPRRHADGSDHARICWNRLLVGGQRAAGRAHAHGVHHGRARVAGSGCGVFDTRGNMVAQSETGTPGHINAMATVHAPLPGRVPARALEPGDVLITNDPWKTAGQLNDVTMVHAGLPRRRRGRLLRQHLPQPDIGGHILSAEAREVYEEGLFIPIMKLYDGGRAQRVAVRDHPRPTSRVPDEVDGRLARAVASGNASAATRLLEFMDEFGLERLEPLADEIIEPHPSGPCAQAIARLRPRRVRERDYVGRLRRADHARGAL